MLMYLFASISVLLLGMASFLSSGLLLLSALVRMFAMGAACCTWVTTPELYTTEMRASGHAVANAFARVGSFFVPFLVNTSGLTVAGVAGVLAVVNFGGFMSSYLLIETKGIIISDQF